MPVYLTSAYTHFEVKIIQQNAGIVNHKEKTLSS